MILFEVDLGCGNSLVQHRHFRGGTQRFLDGEVLAPGWCSTGFRISQFWSGNAGGRIGTSFGEKKLNKWLVLLILGGTPL